MKNRITKPDVETGYVILVKSYLLLEQIGASTACGMMQKKNLNMTNISFMKMLYMLIMSMVYTLLKMNFLYGMIMLKIGAL